MVVRKKYIEFENGLLWDFNDSFETVLEKSKPWHPDAEPKLFIMLHDYVPLKSYVTETTVFFNKDGLNNISKVEIRFDIHNYADKEISDYEEFSVNIKKLYAELKAQINDIFPDSKEKYDEEHCVCFYSDDLKLVISTGRDYECVVMTIS